MLRRFSLCIVLSLAAAGARAQLGLPSHLPGLPGAGLPGTSVIGLPGTIDSSVDRAASSLGEPVDVRAARDLRRRHLADLIRRYPRLIERDPAGAAIVRGEVLAFSPNDAALDRERAAGFSIVRDQTLGALGVRVVVLRAPNGVSTQRALRQLRALDPTGAYDFNHLYSESGDAARASSSRSAGAELDRASTPDSTRRADPGARVGLIDSGVDAHHPVFDDVPLSLHGCAGVAVPAEHGTEVASLLVGQAARFRGAAAGATLYAADVYCGSPTGGAIDAIADAFDWLAQKRVAVINVSLVGPANALLERIVRGLVARGFIIVAAVGNDGPAAPPLYPAAYPGVIGVTGVDSHRRVLMEAERGVQVRFAAPGADMSAALPPHAYAVVRGTSFAAPIVAGLLAPALAEPDPAAAARALEALQRRAVDLGAPGLDPVYGYGLVGAELRTQPALAQTP